MSLPHSLTRFLSAAAATCSLLAAAVPAQAAVIASFDPAFGPAILNLGFRGSMTLDISSGCYALGSGVHANNGACQMTVLSAQINFYNATQNSATTLSTVDLPGAFFAGNYVVDAYFDPLTGQPAAFDTLASNFFTVSVTDTNPLAPINYFGEMVLFFKSGLTTSFAVPAAVTLPVSAGAYLRQCTGEEDGFTCAGTSPTDTSNPGRVTVSVVPEPDSIALALVGLGALIVARRRRAPVTR